MNSILTLIAFLSIVGLIIGLVNPALFTPLFRKQLSRLKIAAIFIIIFLGAAIINGATQPQKNEPPNTAATEITTIPTVRPPTAIPTITQPTNKTVSPSPTQKPTVTPNPTIKYIAPTATPTPIVQQQSSTSSNADQNNAPVGSSNGSVPVGATALCNDGTYSYTANHQGACSHHGGVNVFYN